MMQTRAVLFDFDGVLADTENVHIAAWERTFGAMGWDVSPETCAKAAEIDDRVFLAEIFASRGINDGDVNGWVSRKQKLTVAMLSDFPRLYSGVPELVGTLAGRARLGVVSGTWRENVTVVLEASGLSDRFAIVVGKEDVAECKPAPGAYLLALRLLEIKGDQAVALEDSPSGLAAAGAAGIRAVAVGHRRPPGDWTGASLYVPALSETASVLKAVGVRRETDRKPPR
jgi:HAD superfamily hydrolase (TIGR01509 family)